MQLKRTHYKQLVLGIIFRSHCFFAGALHRCGISSFVCRQQTLLFFTLTFMLKAEESMCLF